MFLWQQVQGIRNKSLGSSIFIDTIWKNEKNVRKSASVLGSNFTNPESKPSSQTYTNMLQLRYQYNIVLAATNRSTEEISIITWLLKFLFFSNCVTAYHMFMPD